MIERRVTHSTAANDPETAAFEKKQYEILLVQYANLILKREAMPPTNLCLVMIMN